MPRVETAAGQVKDGPGTECLYSQQAGLGKKRERTYKTGEPVSKITWNPWNSWKSDGDVTHIEQLQGEGGSG